MEELINANSPEEQTTALNSLLVKANAAIQAVHDSNEVLNEKARQLRNHEMISAEEDALGHIKASDSLVIDESTKQLKLNPETIREKLVEHNADNDAHEDIRATLEVIPKVIAGLTVAGPGTVKTGVVTRFTVSGTTLLVDSYIERFEIMLPNGDILAKSGVNVVNNSTYFDFALEGDDLSTQTILVRAIDNSGSKSEAYPHAIVVSTNNPPVLDAAVVTDLPLYIKPNTTHTVAITGGVDDDGDPIKYRVTNISDPTNIVFSKTENIADGESIELTVHSGIQRNRTYSFTVVGDDGRFGGTDSKIFTFRTNNVPVSTGVTITGVPTYLAPGEDYILRISGGTDVDTQTLSYFITSSDSKITFSKSSGIAENEEITMSVASSITRNTDITLSVVVTDGLENSTAKVFTNVTKVNTLPDVTNFNHSVPVKMYPGQTVSVSFTGITDTTVTGDLYLDVSINSEDYVFGKTKNILVGESVSLTCKSTATRGGNNTITVTVKDGVESVVKTVNVLTNRLPNNTNLELHGLVPFITNDKTYTLKLSGSTDADSDSLEYSIISSAGGKIIFDKSTGLSANEEFTIYTDGLVQNTTVTFTVTVFDGMESTQKIFTSVVNSIPVSTNIEYTLPKLVKPNTTYPGIVIYGGQDVDTEQTLTYSIESNNANVTFSKSTDIASNEPISVTFGDISRSALIGFTITVTDGTDSSSKQFTSQINNLPVVTDVVATITGSDVAGYLQPSKTYTFKLAGATDADTTQTVTYGIVVDTDELSFSKSSGIIANESVTMVASAELSRNTTPEFTVSVTDGLETVTKVLKTVVVNSLPVVTGVGITGIPAYIKPGDSVNISVAGATDIDSDQSLRYSLSCNKPYVSFSKNTGITANESVVMTYAGNAVRNEQPVITVSVTDGLETVTTNINAASVNTLPVMTSVAISGMPAIIKPTGTATIKVAGATDTDGQPLQYSLSCNKEYVSFSKTTGIAANENVTVTYSGAAVRGETPVITVAVSDGIETNTKTVNAAKVNTLPVVSSAALNNAFSYIKPTGTATITVSGATDTDGQTLKYALSCDKAYVTFSKNSDIDAGSNIVMTYGSAAVRGDVPKITISVTDGLETVTKVVNSSAVNRLPVMTSVDITGIPAVIKPTGTASIKVAGATDADGQTLTYSLSCDKAYVTFSKTTGIAANEAVTMTYSSAAVRGEVPIITVAVSDGLETNTKTINAAKVNTLPVMTSVDLSGIPAVIKPTGVASITIVAGTDADGQSLTYSLSCDKAYVTFSKASGLIGGESVTMTYTSAAVRGDVPKITISVTDGLETVTKVVNAAKVNTLPAMTSVDITGIPAVIKPIGTASIKVSGATDADGQSLTYALTCDKAYVTFSKTTGIAANEAVTMTYSSASGRGETPVITVTVTDGLETATKTINAAKVNTLPVMTSVDITGIPAVIKPIGTASIKVSGATDADGQSLTYALTCDKAYVTFSKASGIAANEAVTMTYSGAAVRGETPVITVTVTDGLETATKTINAATVNRLPVATSIDITGIPAVIKPTGVASIKVAGATDADGQSLTYSLSCDKAYVTFSKTTGIAANEAVTMTYSGAATRGETPVITVTVTDGLETATKTINAAKVNTLPVATNITATGLPTGSVPGGSSYTFTLNGATDADGQTVTYTITGGAGLNISPTVGIAAGSNVSFNATKVSSNTNISFTVYAVDSLGEQSTTGKSFTVTVRPIIKINTPSVTSPTSGQVINLPFTFVSSTYGTTIEL